MVVSIKQKKIDRFIGRGREAGRKKKTGGAVGQAGKMGRLHVCVRGALETG